MLRLPNVTIFVSKSLMLIENGVKADQVVTRRQAFNRETDDLADDSFPTYECGRHACLQGFYPLLLWRALAMR
jgi:hypothetical protein